jgi:ABC-type transport system involved in multi-copper enzyme maturation permease subunit
MTIETPQETSPRQRSTVPPATDRFDRLLLSEWTKLWSVRSTFWTLLVLFVVTVGFAVLATWGTMQGVDANAESVPAEFDSTSLTLAGLTFGQLAAAVLGAMVISSEYSTGGIRSTLTAVPGRLRLLLAKALVYVAVAFVVGLVTCFASFFLGQVFLHEEYRMSLGDPGVTRAVIGGALYVAGSGMFGFALGALVRHTAGAITAAVALLLVLPPLTLLLPGDWGDTVTRHFTSNAGQQITSATHVNTVPAVLGPWEGYAWFTLEWVVLLVVAAVLMRRRDA